VGEGIPILWVAGGRNWRVDWQEIYYMEKAGVILHSSSGSGRVFFLLVIECFSIDCTFLEYNYGTTKPLIAITG